MNNIVTVTFLHFSPQLVFSSFSHSQYPPSRLTRDETEMTALQIHPRLINDIRVSSLATCNLQTQAAGPFQLKLFLACPFAITDSCWSRRSSLKAETSRYAQILSWSTQVLSLPRRIKNPCVIKLQSRNLGPASANRYQALGSTAHGPRTGQKARASCRPHY